jgi:phosphatidate phosphatase APP1
MIQITKLALFLATLMFCSILKSHPVSEVKKDETLVFFNTSAWLNQQTDQWHIPIHGWIYEPEDSVFRKGVISDSLETIYGLTTNNNSQIIFDQRINLFLADNESNKSIVIRFANHTYALPASESNGHFETILLVDAKIIASAKVNNQLSYEAVLPDRDRRDFIGKVNLVSTGGVSIISDIDDTIKISEVINRKQLLNHTFFLNFKVVQDIVKLYSELLNGQGSLHFVSSSPWQLYPAIIQFIEQSGFPEADYALKYFRFKDSSFMNLFTSSLEAKPLQIMNIIEKYPHRKFILIGDSGEKDPEVYAKIQQQFPQQIIKILIRNVTQEKASDDRYQALYKNLKQDMWQLFTEVKEINFDNNVKRVNKDNKL